MRTNRISLALILAPALAFALVLFSTPALAQTSVGPQRLRLLRRDHHRQRHPAEPRQPGRWSHRAAPYCQSHPRLRSHLLLQSRQSDLLQRAACAVQETVRANAHEITADWVPSVGIANFRPFGVLGVGLLLNVPDESQATDLLRRSRAPPLPAPPPPYRDQSHQHLHQTRLRLRRRPRLGPAPAPRPPPAVPRQPLPGAQPVGPLFASTKTFTHTSEPMIGAYFNF